MLKIIEDGDNDRVPSATRDCLLALRDQPGMVKHQILDVDRRVLAWQRAGNLSWRLGEIPGVGPSIATALVAANPGPHAFKSGRDLVAWIGQGPRQNTTADRTRWSRLRIAAGPVKSQF